MPMNAQSRRPYRGINFTMLSLEAERYGYPEMETPLLRSGAGR